jgi:hypothetical protein
MPNAPTVVAPPFGILGLDAGTKEAGQRADFRVDALRLNVTSHGYRLAWTRAAVCPCVPLNSQTQQAAPDCDLCSGAGFFYFGPPKPQVSTQIGALSDVQASVLKNTNAFVIRGIMTNLSRSVAMYEKNGTFVDGRSAITVLPENRLGYLDRLVNLDGIAVYTEKLQMGDPELPMKTHYPISGGVNFLADATKRYVPGGDFTVTEGKVVWFSAANGPAVGTPLTIHYNYMPTWLCVTQPHVVRSQNIKAKQLNPQTPEGNSTELVLQAEVMLEHLVGENVAQALLL